MAYGNPSASRHLLLLLLGGLVLLLNGAVAKDQSGTTTTRQTTSDAITVTTPMKSTTLDPAFFNATAYAAMCSQDDFKLEAVCKLSPQTIGTFGKGVDSRYVEEKIRSLPLVHLLSEKCKTGEICDRLWDQMVVDGIKFNWRDRTFRHRYCQLSPCLGSMLEERANLSTCKHPERELSFEAFRLLCQLSEKVVPNGDVLGCLDAAIELLQYNTADLIRNEKDIEEVCNCSSTSMDKCPPSCKRMVKKYFCLTQRCSIDTAPLLKTFTSWSWYFENEENLKRVFNIKKCDEETIIAQQQTPFIIAVYNMYGARQAAIVAAVSISSVCCFFVLAFIIYKRYTRPRLVRDRNEYAELKNET